MSDDLRRLTRQLDADYARRFPRSRAYFERYGRSVLDGTSHAVRWNEPFMPVARHAEGAQVEDLDGHLWVDYWQGHLANLLGHNPPLIRQALGAALEQRRGLQSGMVHEVEGEVAELVRRSTRAETVRFTTSGSLGTFYAVVLARAFTGRDLVLKVSGGWHGSQPFGLKGVSPRETSFDHLESEGLSASTGAEIVLTRFNDVEDLRARFAELGDRVACFLFEPVLGAGGGMVGSREYVTEARRLTETHGSLLLCDEIITGFRFRAGDLSQSYGIRPDLLILGKIMGGGMPVAAVAGRRDVLALSTRDSARVKFEGGTYSAHELSLIAARTLLQHLESHGDRIYTELARSGARLSSELERLAGDAGVPVYLPLSSDPALPGSSLVFVHFMQRDATPPTCPEELARGRHPLIGECLLKSLLLLEDVSTRSGVGAISTEHTDANVDKTLEGYRAVFDRLKRAGLI